MTYGVNPRPPADGVDDEDGGAEPCEFLDWDSTFFDVRTARVVDDVLTPDSVRRINRWCEAAAVRWVYFLARVDDPETTRRAEDGGFRLVDQRVTLEASLAAIPMAVAAGSAATRGHVRRFEAGDLPALRRLARVSFTDSRFYYDPEVPRQKCDALFERWTEQCCAGASDAVLVADDGDGAVGYATCDLAAGATWGSIGLVGVAGAARGRGLGRALVVAALEWAAGRGLNGVTVVTQGRNVAAQRLYQRCGFVTKSVGLYYHKWYGVW